MPDRLKYAWEELSDDVFRCRLPFLDVTVDGVLELGGPGAVYVPGHGAVVDAGFVRRQRDWLTARSESEGTP